MSSDYDELNELLYGKLPGRKEWTLFYVELTPKHVHIYEGNDNPNVSRRHLRSMEIHGSDNAGESPKDKKREYKFFYDRSGDGKYIFKCTELERRQRWIMSLQRHIQRQDLLSRGLLPEVGNSHAAPPPTPIQCEVPRPPPHRGTTLPRHHSAATSVGPTCTTSTRKQPPTLDKRDSGFVSGSGDFSRNPPRSNSGDTTVVHSTKVSSKKIQSHSADGTVQRTKGAASCGIDDEDLNRFSWYWGVTSRGDCEAMLKEKGEVGNFVVRMNDRRDFIMSFWRKDGIHHHKIQKSNDMYRFEKSAVRAEGFNLPDLLDTYMKHCTDKTIGPYGGQLYPNYDEVWNPPEIDFNKFGDKLKGLKEASHRPIFSGGPGMGGRYGGKTLHEMKIEMEEEAGTGTSSSNTSLNETPPPPDIAVRQPVTPPHATPGLPNVHNLSAVLAGLQPVNRAPGATKVSPSPSPSQSPGVATKSTSRKAPPPPSVKPNKRVPPPVTVKPATRQPILPAPVHQHTPSSSLYANFDAHTQMMQEQLDPEFDDDEHEDEYVVPSTLTEQDDSAIYQNFQHNSQNGSEASTPSKYVNLHLGPAGPSQNNESLYANVTYDGRSSKPKPYAPPRNIKRPRASQKT